MGEGALTLFIMELYNLILDWGRVIKGLSQGIYPIDIIQEIVKELEKNSENGKSKIVRLNVWVIGSIDCRIDQNNKTYSALQGRMTKEIAKLTRTDCPTKIGENKSIKEVGVDVGMHDMVSTNDYFMAYPTLFYIGDGDLADVMRTCLRRSGQQPMLVTHNVAHHTLLIAQSLFDFEQLSIELDLVTIAERLQHKKKT
jgi:hypothetical protein